MSRLDFERELRAQYVGVPDKNVLVGRYVAAICPKCGGWTMFNADPLGTGTEWAQGCYVKGGDLIVYWKNSISIGQGACVQSDAHSSKRTCDQ